MFYYYRHKKKVLFSLHEYHGFTHINEEMAKCDSNTIYYLGKLPFFESRKGFILSDSEMFYLKNESLDLLNAPKEKKPVMSWLLDKIKNQQVIYVNTEYPDWQSILERSTPPRWKINIIALGDIGSTLLTGLRLLGSDHISEIGIYDRKANHAKRWEFEMNQTTPPFKHSTLPEVKIINESQLMSCDMLVFCAAKGYSLDKPTSDIRMDQFQQNSEIVSIYAKKARNADFKGIFGILSDPVDLLCKKALLESNLDAYGTPDYKGLSPEQIRGFGLGVMNSRALYYAKKLAKYRHYETEGRAFGPHGNGLVIADSINNYNDTLSVELTELAVKANIKMRDIGFKPYIAPALSSGAYSILATIAGEWHYSSTFLGGAYMGSNNRLVNGFTELERVKLPDKLMERLQLSYDGLKNIM